MIIPIYRQVQNGDSFGLARSSHSLSLLMHQPKNIVGLGTVLVLDPFCDAVSPNTLQILDPSCNAVRPSTLPILDMPYESVSPSVSVDPPWKSVNPSQSCSLPLTPVALILSSSDFIQSLLHYLFSMWEIAKDILHYFLAYVKERNQFKWHLVHLLGGQEKIWSARLHSRIICVVVCFQLWSLLKINRQHYVVKNVSMLMLCI